MSKIYKGYELMKAIADKKIKNGTEFLTSNKTKVYFDGCILRYKEDYYDIAANTEIGMSWFTSDFELIEDNTIDIDSIEELHERYKDYIRQDVYEIIKNNREAIIELQRAVKQLNKEIKELKEK